MKNELPRSVALGKIMAARQFNIKGKPRLKAEIRIGTPKMFGRDTYCPVQLVGFGDEKVRPIYGIDTLQALQLAFRFVEAELERHGDRLRWEGSPAFKSLNPEPSKEVNGAILAIVKAFTLKRTQAKKSSRTKR